MSYYTYPHTVYPESQVPYSFIHELTPAFSIPETQYNQVVDDIDEDDEIVDLTTQVQSQTARKGKEHHAQSKKGSKREWTLAEKRAMLDVLIRVKAYVKQARSG